MDLMNATDFAERRRQVARAIQRRMVAHVAAGGTTDFASSPMENDPAVYLDTARAELEMRELFLKLPLVAGLSQDVPGPGDTLLFDDVGPSVVIVRGHDGLLRGFVNMCTHRASRLVDAASKEQCRARGRFSCPFHAWTFDFEGRLVGLPGRQGFEGVDLSERGLLPVPVAEWNGIIFMRAAASDDPLNVEAHLESFAPELAQLELADGVPIKASSLTARCNWKLALDTYAEGYHFATLHSSTIGASHFSNVAVFDAFGPHWRLNFPDKGVRSLVAAPESEWPEPEYGGVHFLFPNTVLVVGSTAPAGSFVRMFRLFPGRTPDMVTCRIGVYGLRGLDAEFRTAFELAPDDAQSEVTQEDYRVAVEAHANLVNAPKGFRVVYGRNEPAVQLLHRSVGKAVGAPV